MLRVTRTWMVFALALDGCSYQSDEEPGTTSAPHARERGYHYRVRTLPGPIATYSTLHPRALTEDGIVYGTSDVGDAVTTDQADAVTILAKRFTVNAINGSGVVAGCPRAPSPSPPEPSFQATIILEDGTIQPLPPLEGERSSCAQAVSESGAVLVASSSTAGTTYYVALEGEVLPVTPSADELPAPFRTLSFSDLDDRGEVVGNFGTQGAVADRGFRYDPRSNTTTLLEPLPGDPLTRAVEITAAGEVRGYSYTPGALGHVGTWKHDGEFVTLFTMGDSQFPITGAVTWNEAGLAVLSNTSDKHTYLIAEPGLPIDVSSLIPSCDTPLGLSVVDVNEHGDFVGTAPALNGPQGYVFLREDD